MGRVQRKVKGQKCPKIKGFRHFSGLKNGPIPAPKIAASERRFGPLAAAEIVAVSRPA
jgi:hypothetical protein